MLVVVTLVLTALGILAIFLWLGGTNQGVAIILLILPVAMWVILIVCYLETISRLRKNLDNILQKGEWISARLTGNTESEFDKYELKIQEWDASVEKVLKGTEYEHSWKSNIGLTKPENELGLVGLENFFTVLRNYMALRLTRLKEIRDSL